jgi:deoxycytidylate deaminase
VDEVLHPISPILGPELFFGLVGPVGSNLKLVSEVLSSALNKVGYSVEVVRLSQLISSISKKDYADQNEYERIRGLMSDGSALRTKIGHGDFIALLAMAEIRQRREKQTEDPTVPRARTAYILSSLKHPHEIQTLRNVYGNGFFVISAYEPRSIRLESLANKIASSKKTSPAAERTHAEELIERDEAEEDNSLGQSVRGAFPLADNFVDARTKNEVQRSLERFVELIFGYPFHTPTRDEYGMYHANSAALRSADLSRQVGAVISNKEGDVVSVGCNEVPKPLGGLYWPGDDEDHRDFQLGEDTGFLKRKEMVSEVLARLKNGGYLADKIANDEIEKLTRALMSGEGDRLMRGTQIVNILEYGRPVHAEMAALMDAARRGTSIKGCTLYSTTFPCHLCARHIIAGGIDRVVYIEPYPKSRVKELYRDSVEVDPDRKVTGLVTFEPFVGIAPRQYLQLFEMPIRKDPARPGRIIDWHAAEKQPKLKRYQYTYVPIETQVVGGFLPGAIEKLKETQTR